MSYILISAKGDILLQNKYLYLDFDCRIGLVMEYAYINVLVLSVTV